MPITPLTKQFKAAQHDINLNTRRRIAVAAHLEVRAALRAAAVLVALGLEDVLIGSYARDTGIWPGKDVDVFARLTKASIDTIDPGAVYSTFYDVLTEAFPGRITPQDRSVKVDYVPDRLPARGFLIEASKLTGNADAPAPTRGFEFSVDVVGAVRWDEVWGIPQRDTTRWERSAAKERWTRTNPERLTTLTTDLNGGLTIDGQGAYVPTAKTIRQIRRHHLGDRKPGGLFFELVTFEGFASGGITGDTWAEISVATLAYIAQRLTTVLAQPLCDPALGTPYAPAPDAADVAHAATVFQKLAADAGRALHHAECPAAAAWRRIFGDNTQAQGPVFPLPAYCRDDGAAVPVIAVPNRLRGSNEARGFGTE